MPQDYAYSPDLPAIRSAKLPARYEAAKIALATCHKVDECKDWADKFQAIASYAKQAGDDSLRDMATRIQGRAIRRCGELLKEIKAAKNHHDAQKRTGVGAHTSRYQAAKDAGMSRNQRVAALRVASIPQDDFDAAIEADSPATVTELAARGTKTKVIDHLRGRDPADFQAALRTVGTLRTVASFLDTITIDAILRGTDRAMTPEMLSYGEHVLPWLTELLRRLKKERTIR